MCQAWLVTGTDLQQLILISSKVITNQGMETLSQFSYLFDCMHLLWYKSHCTEWASRPLKYLDLFVRNMV